MSFGLRQKAVLFIARLYLLAANPVQIFLFVKRLKFWPNPAFPRRYHEKILWRKIVDRNPLFLELVDKLAAKRISQARLPGLAVAQVIWCGKNPHYLPTKLVSGDVVVKCNQGCGKNIFIVDGKPSHAEIVAKTARWMAKRSHHSWWPQRDRYIFVEEKLGLGGGDLPTDIKVHTFNGQIGHLWVADKLGGRSRTYNADGIPLTVRDTTYPKEEQALPDLAATRGLVARAIKLAPLLLAGLDYARVDFMVVGSRLYFGEYTLCPSGGYDRWLDPALSQRADALWDLRSSEFLRKSHRGLTRLYAESLRAALDHLDSIGLRPGESIATQPATQ